MRSIWLIPHRYLLGGVFSPTYLKAYYTAYLYVGQYLRQVSILLFINIIRWGAAIVLSVNLFILPTSSERELRQTLVSQRTPGH